MSNDGHLDSSNGESKATQAVKEKDTPTKTSHSIGENNVKRERQEDSEKSPSPPSKRQRSGR
ncbi:hypothetical protein KIN20_013024 [Parelaphostrongylus tenuis]|uniref:Uncharacterized protein n=1 Tax=Parelaphostrongylus tenuis TaxID=148309 RepID=A0AAD5QNI3_PARTN|nr:hypothetical protein KIN20_013024 [Parelaphostrongylus tenuis]